NGNVVIADISRLKMDKVMYERVLKDLKEVAKDVNGDIIGLGDQRYVVITPNSVKISRDKIGGVE
ncbi:MAG TPA: cell division protein SepF, partial [Methanoregulaceae archaeon]|nr:cell division protein SepF [Methanoregulaceae archaeon]